MTLPIPPTPLIPVRARRAEPRPGQNPLVEFHPLSEAQASGIVSVSTGIDAYHRRKALHHSERATLIAPDTLVGDARNGPAGYSVIHARLIGTSPSTLLLPTYSRPS